MPQHILIVEDETAIAETLIYAFKEAGFNTTHQLLGATAVTEVANKQIDFVILDVGLPDISGLMYASKFAKHQMFQYYF